MSSLTNNTSIWSAITNTITTSLQAISTTASAVNNAATAAESLTATVADLAHNNREYVSKSSKAKHQSKLMELDADIAKLEQELTDKYAETNKPLTAAQKRKAAKDAKDGKPTPIKLG